VPEYGGDEGSGGEEGGHGGGGMAMSHIVNMSVCLDAGWIEVGEEWRVRAEHDVEAHRPMVNPDGEIEGVMGR
jgi:hypothetical protein